MKLRTVVSCVQTDHVGYMCWITHHLHDKCMGHIDVCKWSVDAWNSTMPIWCNLRIQIWLTSAKLVVVKFG